MLRKITAGAAFLLAGASALAATPHQNPHGMLSLRAVGLVDLPAEDDAGFAAGLGFGVGLHLNQVFVEYDYSRVLEVEPDSEATFMSFSTASGGQLVWRPEIDAYAHSVFVGRRWGRFAFAEFKLGHSYQRFKDGSDVLAEVNTPAAGLEIGLGGSAAGLGLQYLWLGDNYKQVSLSFRAYF
ncbi:hypothetical protein [Litorivivens sp.]|uniref:hypothetical protein n=1 Tax=Litorivivens sp. TaxID=2020868 RepID=UPI003564D749